MTWAVALLSIFASPPKSTYFKGLRGCDALLYVPLS